MLRLFNTDFPTANLDAPTVALLTAVHEFQDELSAISGEINRMVIAGFTQEETWQERQARWDTCRMTLSQYDRISLAVESVADALKAAIEADMDFNQRFVTTIFSNTIADVLIQSIYDNNMLSQDPLVCRLMMDWENHVIIPLFQDLATSGNLALLNNEPLIGEATVMEHWALFAGDPKRGMFQTLGSALSKGFYRALQLALDANDPQLKIPSSFLGNLVAWGLHATKPQDRAAIFELFDCLLINENYSPSTGVYETVQAYVPGKIARTKLDMIRDHQIGVMPDFRDVAPPADLPWQTRLLTAAAVTLDQKIPFTPPPP
jgi:hypothetical protein